MHGIRFVSSQLWSKHDIKGPKTLAAPGKLMEKGAGISGWVDGIQRPHQGKIRPTQKKGATRGKTARHQSKHHQAREETNYRTHPSTLYARHEPKLLTRGCTTVSPQTEKGHAPARALRRSPQRSARSEESKVRIRAARQPAHNYTVERS